MRQPTGQRDGEVTPDAVRPEDDLGHARPAADEHELVHERCRDLVVVRHARPPPRRPVPGADDVAPVSRSDWSSASSFIDRIGPQGMSYLLRISMTSNFVLVTVHSSTVAKMSFSRGRRAAGVA